MRRFPLGALVLVAVAPACGGDGSASDAAPVDGPVDGAGPDAEDLCPGAFTVEGHVFALVAGNNLFDVGLADADNPTVVAPSAPNGRVVLCAAPAAERVVTASRADLVTRRDRVVSASVSQLRAVGHAHELGMFTTTEVAALATDLAIAPPEADSTWVVVHVVALPAGTPLVGAQVTIDQPSAGSFSRQADRSFLVGDTVAAGGAVLIAAPATSPAPVVTATPPDGFTGTCAGPSALAPEPGGISGAVVVCQ